MSNLNNLNSLIFYVNDTSHRIRFSSNNKEVSAEIKNVRSAHQIRNNGKDDLVLQAKSGEIIAISADKIDMVSGVFKQKPIIPQKGDQIKLFEKNGETYTLLEADIESSKVSTTKEEEEKPNLDVRSTIKESGKQSRSLIDEGKDKLSVVTSSKEFKEGKKEGHKIAKEISAQAEDLKDKLIPKDIQRDISDIGSKISKLKSDITDKSQKSFEGSLSSDDKKTYRETKKQVNKTTHKLKDTINDLLK